MQTVVGSGVIEIPKEINLWSGLDRTYYGLALTSFRYFPLKKKRWLRGDHLVDCLSGRRIQTWAQFRMRRLRVDPAKNRSGAKDRRIVAVGELVYPYVYEVLKGSR